MIITKLFSYARYLKYKIVGYPKMKQELLLRLALQEKGFNVKKIKIVVDHDLGLNYVNGIKVGIKYPDSFFEQANELGKSEKIYNYYFNGNMSESGGRKRMLTPFMNIGGTVIVESEDGRIEDKKDKFNKEYFQGLANSKFGLCPHQADWQGNPDALWTYRFIECCFVNAMPVLFKEAPLSENFTKAFYFLWDEDILASDEATQIYNETKALENNIRAKEVFCLSADECRQIQYTLNHK